MLAALIFGKLAALSPEAFSFLKEIVSRDDDHEYVRKSPGNALRDVSRFHKDLYSFRVKMICSYEATGLLACCIAQ
jgi:hypothetical protein